MTGSLSSPWFSLVFNTALIAFTLDQVDGGNETEFGTVRLASIDFRGTFQAATALFSAKNHGEAAKSIGVAPATLQRWLKLPKFEQAFREARLGVFAEVTLWMANGSTRRVRVRRLVQMIAEVVIGGVGNSVHRLPGGLPVASRNR
jgi:hypothetical protein